MNRRSVEQSVELGGALPGKVVENRNPISIALLFYVLTLAAIVAACLGRLTANDQVTSSSVGAVAGVGSLIGLMIGFLGGTFYFKSVQASLFGFGVGAGLGAVAGALTLIAETHFLSMMAIAFAGCWLLLVVMLLTARWRVH